MAVILEVASKGPSASTVFLIFLSLGITGIATAVWHRWTAIPVLLASSTFATFMILKLRDPFIWPARQPGAGWDYLAALYYGTTSSFILTVIGVWWRTRSLSQGRNG